MLTSMVAMVTGDGENDRHRDKAWVDVEQSEISGQEMSYGRNVWQVWGRTRMAGSTSKWTSQTLCN